MQKKTKIHLLLRACEEAFKKLHNRRNEIFRNEHLKPVHYRGLKQNKEIDNRVIDEVFFEELEDVDNRPSVHFPLGKHAQVAEKREGGLFFL